MLRAVCLDVETGDLIHDVEVFARDTPGAIHEKNSHATPTPIIACDRVYLHFGTYGTACVSTAGEVLWRKQIEYDPVHGPGSSPVLVGDVLIFSCDGRKDPFVVALEKQTGDVRWKMPRPDAPADKPTFAFSTALVMEMDGRTEVVIPGSNSVCSYEPATGREIWHVKYPGGFSTVPRPVQGHGLVYMSTGYGPCHLLAIRLGGEGDVTETNVVWRESRGPPLNPSPLLVGDELYMVADNGVVTCLDAHTGEAHYRKRIAGNYSASPLHAAGRIYINNETGLTMVFRPGPQFEQLATNQVEGRTLASLTPIEGALLLRTDTHLYRIEAQ